MRPGLLAVLESGGGEDVGGSEALRRALHTLQFTPFFYTYVCISLQSTHYTTLTPYGTPSLQPNILASSAPGVDNACVQLRQGTLLRCHQMHNMLYTLQLKATAISDNTGMMVTSLTIPPSLASCPFAPERLQEQAVTQLNRRVGCALPKATQGSEVSPGSFHPSPLDISQDFQEFQNLDKVQVSLIWIGE